MTALARRFASFVATVGCTLCGSALFSAFSTAFSRAHFRTRFRRLGGLFALHRLGVSRRLGGRGLRGFGCLGGGISARSRVRGGCAGGVISGLGRLCSVRLQLQLLGFGLRVERLFTRAVARVVAGALRLAVILLAVVGLRCRCALLLLVLLGLVLPWLVATRLLRFTRLLLGGLFRALFYALFRALLTRVFRVLLAFAIVLLGVAAAITRTAWAAALVAGIFVT